MHPSPCALGLAQSKHHRLLAPPVAVQPAVMPDAETVAPCTATVASPAWDEARMPVKLRGHQRTADFHLESPRADKPTACDVVKISEALKGVKDAR
ncbi:hypothetical protein CYMTET_54430 [Cymbomonas tetramitiformis]|uniref:Uncharacterized protein n=1 Tax=Cymbomonas tetramitiformis TaxID=36881 RepID=A0AAE0BEY7_9CHLO|nr:hypothetical protein CYMTET_54430 [Cymbomonas tetramitiformis]